MKKVATLFGVLVLLVLVAVLFQNRRSRELGGSGRGAAMRTLLLPDLAVDDVQKIRIRDKDQSVEVLVKDGKWRVPQRSDYPAATDKIRRALMSFLELKVTQKTVVGKTALAELNLDVPKDGATDHTGLYVEFLNGKDGVVASFVAGKNVESTGGANSNSFMGGPGEQRFVRVLQDDGANNVYTIWTVGDSLSEFQPKAEDWIDKAFVDVRRLKSAEITALNPADSWGAARADESKEFKLVGGKPGEELDTAKASGLSYLLSGASFTDVLTKDKASPNLFKSAIKAKLDTFEDFHYQVEAASKKDTSKPDADSVYYFKVSVSADIPAERKAEANEKPEDKKKKDEAFASQKKLLEEKLTKEKSLEGWVYEVSSTTLGVILKKKSEVLREKAEKEKPAVGPNGIPQINIHPPGATPPVSLPPAPAPKPEAPEPPKPEAKPEAPAPTPPPAPKPADKPAPAPAPAHAAPTPPPAPKPADKPTPPPAEKPADKPAPAPAPANAAPAPTSAPEKTPENKPAPAAPTSDAKPAGS